MKCKYFCFSAVEQRCDLFASGNLFHNRPAQMQDWQLVRLDITETTADSKAILARYKLFGPPALPYYQDGQLVNQQVGEIGRAEFEQTLTALN